MVRVVVYRLYSPAEALAMASAPELMVKKIRSDRQRDPMAIIEAPDVDDAAKIVTALSRAFGVCIMDINHGVEPMEPSHYLLDQGSALLSDAHRINEQASG
jgi:hypothetical protein